MMSSVGRNTGQGARNRECPAEIGTVGAYAAVVLGINSMSNAGSNFHEAKPSEISCITSAIHP